MLRWEEVLGIKVLRVRRDKEFKIINVHTVLYLNSVLNNLKIFTLLVIERHLI